MKLVIGDEDDGDSSVKVKMDVSWRQRKEI